MTTYQGFVSKIITKEGTSSRGRRWQSWAARLEKEDGTEYPEWISFGFEKPSVKEGDYVKIETAKDDKGYQKVVSATTLKNPPAKAANQPQSAGAVPPSPGIPNTYVSTRDTSIQYQSSRKDAIAVLELLISKDALPLTGAKTKAGEQARYEEISALVDKLTVRFYNDVATMRVLDKVEDEGAETEETANAAVETEEQDDPA
jgi:ribosomal 50S subunit-recycling heat shock protein